MEELAQLFQAALSEPNTVRIFRNIIEPLIEKQTKEIKQEIKTLTTCIKAQATQIKSLETNVNTLKCTVHKQGEIIKQQQTVVECIDRKEREKNIIITGLQEDCNLEDAKTDKQKCHKIWKAAHIELQQNTNSIRRLGKEQENKIRPLMVTVQTKEIMLGT